MQLILLIVNAHYNFQKIYSNNQYFKIYYIIHQQGQRLSNWQRWVFFYEYFPLHYLRHLNPQQPCLKRWSNQRNLLTTVAKTQFLSLFFTHFRQDLIGIEVTRLLVSKYSYENPLAICCNHFKGTINVWFGILHNLR